MIFMFITAAVLAEICSALPLSGSIYIWSAESAGPKYARFFGFIVAWWSTTAWMTFAAGNCQVRFTDLSLWNAVLKESDRLRRTTSYHNWLSGKSTSPAVLATTTSNGVPSSGPSPKVSSWFPLPSTTFLRAGIRSCSSSPLRFTPSTSCSVSSGFPSAFRRPMASAQLKTCSP